MTKLHIPELRPTNIPRSRLFEKLNRGQHRKFSLVSAPAGFGKTTLIAEWITAIERPAAWLSLDTNDSDPTRFLRYVIAALQTTMPDIGARIISVLEASQPPPIAALLTPLLNELSLIPHDMVLVLDDYHVLDSTEIDEVLAFLIDNQPPKLHLVITTREDPQLPLARLRARGELTEIRVTDLRFSTDEAADFLNQTMGLNLLPNDISALAARTEGWIAGLQLAAISLQPQQDTTGFIQSFTGSHHFVLDYLVEEVLNWQPPHIQDFLLKTSILDRLCAPLCDAIMQDDDHPSEILLRDIQQANLFLVALDNERNWFRYHHLFAELLRKQLQQNTAEPTKGEGMSVAELHIRASIWYEDNGLEVEAFHHATAANDIRRAVRLIEGNWMPMHFRGLGAPILGWLRSLPTSVLDAWPVLWTTFASLNLAKGQLAVTEQNLQSAEASLERIEHDDMTRDLIGRVAAIRSTLAAGLAQVDTIITESERALEYLHPDNLAFRTSTAWKLGYAHQLQGKRDAAMQAYGEVISIGELTGNVVFTRLAITNLGRLYEYNNQLYLAEKTYLELLEKYPKRPHGDSCLLHLGLARIYYQWNDLDTAQEHCNLSIQFGEQSDYLNRLVHAQVFLARLKLAHGDVTDATVILAEASQSVRQNNMVSEASNIADAQIRILLSQGLVAAAAQLAEEHDLPMAVVRVHLAQGDPVSALSILADYRQQMEAKGWHYEQLMAIVLQSVVLDSQGRNDEALEVLLEALPIAVIGGFIRLFLDEGLSMASLFIRAKERGNMPDYVGKVIAAFEAEHSTNPPHQSASQPLVEPLSDRELEILQLLADGLSNRDVSKRLFIALDTVKGHNRNIYQKLQVKRRTEAVARARELGLI